MTLLPFPLLKNFLSVFHKYLGEAPSSYVLNIALGKTQHLLSTTLAMSMLHDVFIYLAVLQPLGAMELGIKG